MARILLSEDDESVRSFVGRALAMDGHEVVAEEDGAAAMDRLRREDGRFDLLITDIMMPVMDGIGLALNVARSWPQLTILLMTGYANQRERASGLDGLVHDVVTKPFTLAEIRQHVAGALAAATRPAASAARGVAAPQ